MALEEEYYSIEERNMGDGAWHWLELVEEKNLPEDASFIDWDARTEELIRETIERNK